MSDMEKVRRSLHETIQDMVSVDEELPEGAMLLGWVAIAEWMAPDGKRWLSIVDGAANGEGCAEWQRQGYLFSALHTPGDFIPDDEDE